MLVTFRSVLVLAIAVTCAMPVSARGWGLFGSSGSSGYYSSSSYYPSYYSSSYYYPSYYGSSYYYPSYYPSYYSSYYPSYYSSYYSAWAYPASNSYYVPVIQSQAAFATVAAPVYSVPATIELPQIPVVPQVQCPTATVAVPALAAPVPAPPSASPSQAPPQTGEPPAAKDNPKIDESRSFYQAFPNTTLTSAQINDRCQVGFWNVTRRDIRLNVNGQAYTLARGKMTTLTLPRRFAWQYDQGRINSEDVPRDRKSAEIIIRN